ncbi:GNAT family N-acetyltransferase [Kiloniella sp. EL199]|uniref:GNAT family N-acetyltransferase n=1 Tax=Kiloniella sp. EL199 TaxID=2107581 RepID=UPI000EA3B491|nr:GNAT family N-acetyltransferase [Kiloniella sp. EL199]
MLTDRPEASSFESLTPDDVPAIYNLIENLGWTHVAKDLEIMLQVGIFLGVRDANDDVIATGALFPYGTGLASIGMIMVSPEYQRRGYGRAVMDALHGHDVTQGRTLCLIATEEGEPLYRRCGYQVAGRIRKFFGSPEVFLSKSTGPRLDHVMLREMQRNDMESVVRLDTKALGASRHELLEQRFLQADHAVVAENKDGEIIGFTLASPQREQHHVGPMVAPDRDTALAMIRYVAERSTKELRIDVPEKQAELHNLLPDLGFDLIANPPSMVRPSTMRQKSYSSLGQSVYPGCRELYWSIMSQAYG